MKPVTKHRVQWLGFANIEREEIVEADSIRVVNGFVYIDSTEGLVLMVPADRFIEMTGVTE